MTCQHINAVLGFSKNEKEVDNEGGVNYPMVSICIECKEVIKIVNQDQIRRALGIEN